MEVGVQTMSIDDDLETSAAVADIYSSAREGEGAMGPPRSPVRRLPRASRMAAIVGNASVSAPLRPTSPPPADLLARAQTPIIESDFERVSKSASAFRRRKSSTSRPSARPHTSQSMTRSGSRSLKEDRSSVIRPKISMALSDHGATTTTTPIIARYLKSTAVTPVNDQNRARAHTPSSSISGASFDSRRMSMASDRTSDAEDHSTPLASARTTTGSSDPFVINAITQLMIGEMLYKYARRSFGKERRHGRFFWVHPYTSTLYWSMTDPGAEGINESTAKSST